ncbi:MAG: rod shape-determining protein MreD [Leptospiraceae bacterium]|jgi:rod shape-determining protein MreD|nr:rod shape-determining protein MreD [Leptospiraceae bacterium]MCZ8347600.1 rod shape-determining protein MreD [Leptospiraceae bacterium]PJE03904.1 MAG: rod shape-determining protein MreD [Leptospira sp.]
MIIEKVVILIGMLFAHFLNGSNLFELGGSFKPDFMMIYIIFFSLRKGSLYGIWIGFLGGLLTDSGLGGETGADQVTYYKIGLHSFTFSIIGYIVGKFTRNAYNENYLSISIYNFIFTLLSRIILYFMFILFFHDNLNYSFLSTSIYTSILAPLFFFFLTWVFKLEADESKI